MVFRDDFEKPALNPAWKIDLEDKDRWALEGGHLVLVTQPHKAATAAGKEVLKNRFILDRSLPSDYTVTARVSVALANGGNVVSLRVRTVTDNHVGVSYEAHCRYNCLERWRRPFINKWVAGQLTEQSSENRFWDQGKPTQIDLNGFTRTSEVIWLRLRKQGSTFIGSFSFDGARFETIGEQTLLYMDGSRLELAVYDRGPGIETGARFDFIEVVR